MQTQQQEQFYQVRITEPVRYVPEGGVRETLQPGDERTMAGADAFNIVGSGRGVFIDPTEVPNLKGGKKQADKA